MEDDTGLAPTSDEARIDAPVTGRAIDPLTASYFGSLALSGAALTIGAALIHQWAGVVLCLLCVALGFLTEGLRRARALAGLVFVGLTGLGALNVLWGAPALWSLVGVAAATGVWDLNHFRRRLDAVDRVVDQAAVVRDHLTRLGAMLGGAVAIGGIALSLHLSYGVAALSVLSLILIVGLSRGIGFLRRESN